ncbi:peptidase U32 family protein [Desulfosarcina ovata]|uniref:Peptidase U32 n=1 Tax=Desulfosarcina ovata subsp. ovata TaxID=2752305 RepID=A0A5K8A7K0_9BACT|nr:U32 family peptidase [Desulfosarcina ovata]BBO88451.1 peptidase U32 [Desulfosarcina ovata subsp. ovata]
MTISSTQKIELLAPAGTPEKLEIAIHYGADAVYLAGRDFSLRNFSANFSRPEMLAARRLTRERGIRMYVAVNIYSRDSESGAIADYLDFLGTVEPDALIVADPAIFMQARKRVPGIPLHISTQANTTNSGTARFWQELGATRVNAARELTLEEIRSMAADSGIAVESFVHGAMCMAYSGRCLMSGFMAKRESNRGLCCQPCRFSYAVVEETRPGQYFPIAGDERGSYIFNARDLCMIEHLPEMIGAGIASLKIEGRMKSIHYLAGVVKVYREAIDAWYRDPDGYALQPHWLTELAAISHRGYCTGFYFGDPHQTAANTENRIHPGYRFVAKVTGRSPDGGTQVQVKNRIFENEAVDVISPGGPSRSARIAKIVDEHGQRRSPAHPGSQATFYLNIPTRPLDLIRCPADDPGEKPS